MTETTGLQGLRAAAEATLLSDLRVTPELRQQVLDRVAALAAEAEAPSRPPRPTRRWLDGAGWAVAAAAVVLALVMAGPRSLPSNPVPQSAAGQAPAPEHAPAAQSAPAAPVPASAGSTAATVPPGTGKTDGMKLSASPGNLAANGTSSGTINVTVLDSNGNTVGQRAMDQAGAAKQMQSGAAAGAAEAQPGRKIISNGDFGLEVPDVRAAVDRLRSLTEAAGGYVAEASLDGSPGDSMSAHMLLRIPATRSGGLIADLKGLGRVFHERQWTQDVTDQYMDLENRIAVQEAQGKRLQDLAARAASFEDWNKVTAQLNETQVQIENMKGRLKLLQNQVEYAIIQVSLQQPRPGQVSLTSNNPTLAQQFRVAFLGSGHSLLDLLRRAAVGLVALLPWAVSVLLLAGLLWLLWRRRRRAG